MNNIPHHLFCFVKCLFIFIFVLNEITQSFATETEFNIYSLKHWKNNGQSVSFKDSADKLQFCCFYSNYKNTTVVQLL